MAPPDSRTGNSLANYFEVCGLRGPLADCRTLRKLQLCLSFRTVVRIWCAYSLRIQLSQHGLSKSLPTFYA